MDTREAAEGPPIPQALLDTTVAALQASNTQLAALKAHIDTLDQPAP